MLRISVLSRACVRIDFLGKFTDGGSRGAEGRSDIWTSLRGCRVLHIFMAWVTRKFYFLPHVNRGYLYRPLKIITEDCES